MGILDKFKKVFDNDTVNEDISQSRVQKAISKFRNPSPKGGERHPARILGRYREENQATIRRLEQQSIRHAQIQSQRNAQTAAVLASRPTARQQRAERFERFRQSYKKYADKVPYSRGGAPINEAIQRLARKQVRIRTKGGGSYTREQLRGQGRATASQIKAVNLIAGAQARVPASGRGGGSGYQGGGYAPQGRSGGRPGRPRGTYDMRYAQFGGVYGYRKWIANQRRIALLKARGQAPQQMQQQTYSEQPQMENQMPAQPQYQEQPPMPQQQPGVKLWDPNFMKLSTGQSNQGVPVKKVDALNPELPQGDKHGDYYTEPDFFSGKQVLRRRSQDKLFKW